MSIAQWEFAWPNLDLPNIEARSEVSWNPFEDTVSFGAVTEDFIFGRFLGRKETVFLTFVLFRGRI